MNETIVQIKYKQTSKTQYILNVYSTFSGYYFSV